jgi:hypothetical protein
MPIFEPHVIFEPLSFGVSVAPDNPKFGRVDFYTETKAFHFQMRRQMLELLRRQIDDAIRKCRCLLGSGLGRESTRAK